MYTKNFEHPTFKKCKLTNEGCRKKAYKYGKSRRDEIENLKDANFFYSLIVK